MADQLLTSFDSGDGAITFDMVFPVYDPLTDGPLKISFGAFSDYVIEEMPSQIVGTNAALKALDTSKHTSARLTLNGRAGFFYFRTGDYTDEIAADIAEGIYLKADDTDADQGAWVRGHAEGVYATWFGGIADAISLTVTATIASGSANFSISENTFTADDVGKVISVEGAGVAGACLVTTIATYVSPTQITLADNASTTVTGAATIIGYGTDNDVAISTARAVAQLEATSNGDVRGSIVLGPGDWLTTGSINLPTAIRFRCYGNLYHTTLDDIALIIGSDSEDVENYDIRFSGVIRSLSGNIRNLPTAIDAGGSTGIEILKMKFSTLKVQGIIGFTKHGFYGNSTNDIFTGQHIQDNNIDLGQIAYNGAGFITQSVSALLGAFQVNHVRIQNSFSNFNNIDIGQAGDTNTNNNIFDIIATDNAAPSGTELRIYGILNEIRLAFTEGTIHFGAGSAFNNLFVARRASDITITDDGANNLIHDALGVYTPGIGKAFQLRSDADSADAGPYFDLLRESPSPANNDNLGGFRLGGMNDADEPISYVVVRADVPSITDGNENGRLLIDTYVGGGYGNRVGIWQGMTIGSAVGGDKGAGTLNVAGEIYRNNAAYTNPDYVIEMYYNGDITLFKDNEGASAYQGIYTLDDLEVYLKTNLRLPGITDDPSGIFKRSDIILEKIEELTLYAIELHNRNKELVQRVSELEQKLS